MKLAAALFALSTVAFAQTSTTPPAKSATAAHHATTAAAAKPTSAIPHVAGIPKTLYALKYIDIKIGTGPLAEPQKFYTVHYTGWLTDGKKFDSSVDRNQPFTFPYGAKRVITGWDTGFEGMHVGGKRRLFIPYQLAYGLIGNPAHGMPAKANLIFDVELISMSDAPPAPPTPPAAKPIAPQPVPQPAAAKPATQPVGQEPQPASTPNPAAAPNARPVADPAAPKPPAQPASAPPSR